MSISRMSAIWQLSTQKGSDLLLMLALADAANDDGFCWPSVSQLAQKTRMSRSTVLRALQRLEESGEVFADHNRRRGNRYLIIPGLAEESIRAALRSQMGMSATEASANLALILDRLDKSQYETEKSQNDTKKSQSDTSQIDTSEVSGFDTSEVSSYDTSEVSLVTHDPSRTVNEPSVEAEDLRAEARKVAREMLDDLEAKASAATAKKIDTPAQADVSTVTVPVISESLAAVTRAYTSNISVMVNDTVSEMLKDAVDAYPIDWILDAIKQAVLYNKRSWAYVEAILRRRMNEGAGPYTGPAGRRDASPPTPDPDCPHCGGMGFYTRDVPPGDPDFGKAIACDCLKVRVRHERV